MGKWMKAIACGLLLCLCISLCGFSAECGEIRERVLRLHILANSDSGEDQQLKLKVRDAVVREAAGDRKSTRLNSSHPNPSRMPSSA